MTNWRSGQHLHSANKMPCIVADPWCRTLQSPKRSAGSSVSEIPYPAKPQMIQLWPESVQNGRQCRTSGQVSHQLHSNDVPVQISQDALSIRLALASILQMLPIRTAAAQSEQVAACALLSQRLWRSAPGSFRQMQLPSQRNVARRTAAQLPRRRSQGRHQSCLRSSQKQRTS